MNENDHYFIYLYIYICMYVLVLLKATPDLTPCQLCVRRTSDVSRGSTNLDHNASVRLSSKEAPKCRYNKPVNVLRYDCVRVSMIREHK